MAKKRNYKREYATYHGTRKQKDNRNKRNKARRSLGLRKGDGMHVDHKKPLSKGGGNGKSNLRKVTAKKNLSRKRK
tara:strand:- start:285 stop:512 length:228 start_codon:yes stop_codon:yes gene_type:complete